MYCGALPLGRLACFRFWFHSVHFARIHLVCHYIRVLSDLCMILPNVVPYNLSQSVRFGSRLRLPENVLCLEPNAGGYERYALVCAFLMSDSRNFTGSYAAYDRVISMDLPTGQRLLASKNWFEQRSDSNANSMLDSEVLLDQIKALCNGKSCCTMKASLNPSLKTCRSNSVAM